MNNFEKGYKFTDVNNIQIHYALEGNPKNPTLVLVGSNDLSTPPEQVQSTANLIKNSKFHVLKNSGHLPCVDNPDEFAKIIKNFLF